MKNINQQIQETLKLAGVQFNEAPYDEQEVKDYQAKYGYFDDSSSQLNQQWKTLGDFRRATQSLPDDTAIYGIDNEYGFTTLVRSGIVTNPETKETAILVFADRD